MKIDLVKQLISEFENSDVFKMKVEIEDIKLELEKEPALPVNVMPAPLTQVPVMPSGNMPVVENQTTATNTSESEPEMTGTPVKSPIVGVFYAASSPNAAPYVEVGSKVKAGQTLCIIEAMKVMNEIKSPIDGTVSQILVKTEDLVEFDQVIMVIEGN